jgi:hypothetical protein
VLANSVRLRQLSSPDVGGLQNSFVCLSLLPSHTSTQTILMPHTLHSIHSVNRLENRLYDFPDGGYVIDRTTYTTESYTAFPHTIKYIDACFS